MITEIQGDLIDFLKSIGLSKNDTLMVDDLAGTDEIRLKLLQMMADRYIERGKVTEEEVDKMLLILIGSKKNSGSDS